MVVGRAVRRHAERVVIVSRPKFDAVQHTLQLTHADCPLMVSMVVNVRDCIVGVGTLVVHGGAAGVATDARQARLALAADALFAGRRLDHQVSRQRLNDAGESIDVTASGRPTTARRQGRRHQDLCIVGGHTDGHRPPKACSTLAADRRVGRRAERRRKVVRAGGWHGDDDTGSHSSRIPVAVQHRSRRRKVAGSKGCLVLELPQVDNLVKVEGETISGENVDVRRQGVGDQRHFRVGQAFALALGIHLRADAGRGPVDNDVLARVHERILHHRTVDA
mmetsp:Transcript_14238/g.44815  ORF Transcript_14238/g.44815 Transcript_14238/m.44815 type:complete len:278 (+) Transcript_14238:1131-1964(+)